MSDQETDLRAVIAKLHAELDALTYMPQEAARHDERPAEADEP